MIYRFSVGGKINAESLDDAIDIIKLLLEEKGIDIRDINIFDLNAEVTEVCRKK